MASAVLYSHIGRGSRSGLLLGRGDQGTSRGITRLSLSSQMAQLPQRRNWDANNQNDRLPTYTPSKGDLHPLPLKITP